MKFLLVLGAIFGLSAAQNWLLPSQDTPEVQAEKQKFALAYQKQLELTRKITPEQNSWVPNLWNEPTQNTWSQSGINNMPVAPAQIQYLKFDSNGMPIPIEETSEVKQKRLEHAIAYQKALQQKSGEINQYSMPTMPMQSWTPTQNSMTMPIAKQYNSPVYAAQSLRFDMNGMPIPVEDTDEVKQKKMEFANAYQRALTGQIPTNAPTYPNAIFNQYY